jgi:hypothetical protein
MTNFLSNPFPNGVLQPTGSSLGPATKIGNELNKELHSQRTPMTYDFNLGTESHFCMVSFLPSPMLAAERNFCLSGVSI